MPKIKVLHLSMTKSIGGIASFQKNLFDNIDKTSFAFEFVSTYPNAALAEYFENAGAVVHKLPPQKTVLPYCTALFKLLKKQKYNIVHIHKNSCANPLAFLVCALAGVKIVCHSHNTKAVGGKAADLAHYIFRPFVKRASAVWAACSAEAGVWLYGKKAVKSGKVVVVKNGINLPSFAYNTAVRNKARAQLNLQNALIIGHVGNYIPQKNHKFIIDIFAQIAKSKPNSALLLVGRGEKMPEFENYARQKGLADKVHFLGSRTDANELYQAMDVFLFPSLHEGLPIAGVEAQAAGLCCFFSENVTQDIILNSNSTRLPLSFSAEKWAEIILEKSSNFNRCDVSDDIAKSGYSAEKTAKSMEEIYYGVQS